MQREAQMAQARREAERNLQVNGQPMDLNREQMEAYASMPEDARQRLQHFMEKYKASAERNPKLYGNFIHSVFAKTLLEQQMRLEDAATGCEAPTRNWGFCIGIFPSSRIQKYPRPFPSSKPSPGKSTASWLPRDTEAVIAASWTSAVPSERGWKPAAAFPGSAIRKNEIAERIWCFSVTCPGP